MVIGGNRVGGVFAFALYAMPRLRAGILVLAALACTVTGAAAQAVVPSDTPDRLDLALRQSPRDGEPRRVIITYRRGAGERLKGRLSRRGDAVTSEHPGLDALSVELRRGDARRLAADPDILGISTDAEVAVVGPFDTGLSAALSAAAVQDAQALRSTLGVTAADDASSVGVAIVDSGIAPTPDLAGRIVAFYDFTRRRGVAARPSDAFGHGTHVAGLIAGSGALSGGRYVGVTNVRLIGLKVLDARGRGRTSHVINAIDFAVANRRRLGIDVINLSLGHPILEPAATDPLVRAVERAVAAGIVVVTSAGNHGADASGQAGYGGITSPGNAPSAITVGSFASRGTADRSDDAVSAFSSRGPTWHDGILKPDVLAPGQGLVAISTPSTTLFRDGRFGADVAPYLRLSGTSMSTAVATAVAALVIEANRRDEGPAAPLSPNAVKAILQYTAIPLPDEDPATSAAFEQGAGGINAAGAIALARAIDPGARVGEWWLEQAIVPSSSIAGRELVWSQHIVWGTHIVWGPSVMWNQKAWSARAAWGRRANWTGGSYAGENLVRESLPVWTSHIVWGSGLVAVRGTHIVWGSLWDEHIVWGSWRDEHIVWGSDWDEHIVWGSGWDEHIVWGTVLTGPAGSALD